MIREKIIDVLENPNNFCVEVAKNPNNFCVEVAKNPDNFCVDDIVEVLTFTSEQYYNNNSDEGSSHLTYQNFIYE